MITGVHAAIVTHFDAELRVDHDAVAAQVTRLLDAGIAGIVVNGTMGEANSLTAQERAALVRTTVDAAAGRGPVCVGVSAPSADAAGAHARAAAEAGASSVMALPPLLYRADDDELLAFLHAVADATELPLMVYNNPEATGVDLTPAQLQRIVSEIAAVGALKETSGDARRIADLVARCPGVDVLVGGDDCALEGAAAGAAGWISGVSVVAPAECVALWEAASAGELTVARERYQRLLGLARFDMNPKLVQYFKAALDALGLPGGPCRPPRLELSAAESEALRAAVRTAVGAAVA